MSVRNLAKAYAAAQSPADRALIAAEALTPGPDGDLTAMEILARLAAVTPSAPVTGIAAKPFLALIEAARAQNRRRLAAALAIVLRRRVTPPGADHGATLLMNAVKIEHFSDPGVVASIGRAAEAAGLANLSLNARLRFTRLRPYWRDPKNGENVVRALVLNRLPNLAITEERFVYNQSNLPRGYAEGKMHERLALDVLLLQGVDIERHLAAIAPPDVVINNIGDADVLTREGKGPAIRRIADHFGARLINPPETVAALSRDGNYRRIGETDRVVFPRTFRIAPGEDADRAIERISRDVGWPAIIRDQSSHMGRGAVLSPGPAMARAALTDLAASGAFAIAFHDCRQPDGLYHGYRIYMIGDHFTPSRLHCGAGWNVHSADHDAARADRTDIDFDALEARYWDDPESVVGRDNWAALKQVLRDTGLDFCGLDFTIMPDGRALIFEVNPAMHIRTRGREAFERLLGVRPAAS